MQVIGVKYLVELPLLALKLLGHFLGSEEPLLMLLGSWKLQRRYIAQFLIVGV